ncbi:hypothetical protein [Helicobacter sp. 11S02629-2]|uniref:hypothetical protein n=1 Tax=Helicobacter sp. 11S02629-2 TaxID=1476195 RepID=UPI000BA6E6C1|nr:hypothetical protein [Helicobacter sp. 11S02629-2]PAF44153.1 hypothetical protein BKH40_06035 [Helicobacter sp. 11S02629-2]
MQAEKQAQKQSDKSLSKLEDHHRNLYTDKNSNSYMIRGHKADFNSRYFFEDSGAIKTRAKLGVCSDEVIVDYTLDDKPFIDY